MKPGLLVCVFLECDLYMELIQILTLGNIRETYEHYEFLEFLWTKKVISIEKEDTSIWFSLESHSNK